ncbi:MAG: TonB-dependent receptor [Lutibacter sp.]|uniref:TonB-dependent receptor n=1 Tax=Lutibacter sp. TaxID=1925666 RepID=UPI00299F270D|nr:TonB-dependent receptor [Lutibacter sp.]MDX1828466.1 TonB-dependent receptor [Lutibacter sp.]
MKKLLSVVFALSIGSVMMAQTTITGTVKDAKADQPIPGANIKVVGLPIGTTADFDGNFTLKVSENPPFVLEVTLMGYSTKKVEITQLNQQVDVKLSEEATALDEVVVSASRTPERVLESPVTIEHMDVRAIRNTSSPTFYDGLENLKGVDVNTSSLTFKSINTRGFATFANSRFMQLVDGMDNSSPALNFNLGNLLGMSELDVNSVELLPGASSALYGANAFNGILFMTSKNPFDSPGVSTYVKTGLTSQKAAGDRNYVDAGIRMAYKFSDKFAAKANFSFLKGTEWYATDYRDYNNPGLTRNDPAYDGLNIYGDEVSTTLDFEQIALDNGVPSSIASMMGSSTVSRTGYKEVDLMDYVAQSVKASFALHYRPFDNNIEFIYNAKFGKGSTIYQGANRYSIKNFFLQQHKFEVRGDDFFARIYTTSEDAGNSYDSRFAAINLNRSWKSDTQWFTEYAGAYVNTFVGTILGGGTPDPSAIAQQARAYAQTGALVPGTVAFKNAFDAVISDPNLNTGAKFVDNTKIYHADVNYNFQSLIDFADIQVGGSWREYSLNSQGTIFTDYDGAINYNEYGAYMQVQKKFVDDRLKFTGSIRYDKAKNFDGNYSPRVSLSYSLGENKTRNLRASFQTGFRNPTTQDQYIGLDAGRAILVGSAPDNLDRYLSAPFSVSPVGQSLGVPSTVQISGRAAYDNSFTLESVLAGAPVKSNIALIKPEKISAFEVGYRAGFGSFMLDASAYYNEYKDFIGVKTVIVPYYGQANFSDFDPNTMPAPPAAIALSQGDYKPFQVYTNSPADITSYGATIGVASKVFDHFKFGINYTLAKFDFNQSSDPDYEASFNTPEHKVKVSFGSNDLFENLGFKIDYRWSDKYLWESTFADGMIAPRNVVDAQINYTVPSIKSVFKIGGANIAGKEYVSAPGVGQVGSQYYVSWTINP